ncbi:MAG: acyltransferase [Oligoflexia bacterium]|nr:acyltransferase [Oligoflexia bacterium]
MDFWPSPKLNNSGYRSDIDGLRAFAVLMVVAYHAFPAVVPGGFVGVDVFFVVSGYLISGVILSALEAGRFSFWSFYKRRILRIFPALLALLLAGLCFGWFWLIPEEYSRLGLHTATSTIFVQNFMLWKESGYFDIASELKPLLHLWSLGIEEQFYIFYPFIVWIFWRLGRCAFGGLALIGVCSLAWSAYAVIDDRVTAFYLPQMRLWELVAGGLVLINERGWRPACKKNRSAKSIGLVSLTVTTRTLLSALGIAVLAVVSACYTRETAFPGLAAMVPVCASACVIMAGPESWINRSMLARGPLRQIGLMSYSLYLWHWMLLSFARIILVGNLTSSIILLILASSFITSWFTYRFLEFPFRSLRSPGSVVYAVLGLVFAMFATGCLGWFVHERDGLPDRVITTVAERAIIERHRVEDAVRQEYPLSGCDYDARITPRASHFCSSYGDTSNPRTIVIWGDSHADAWAPAFFEAGRRLQKRILLFSVRGCPPILNVRRTDGVSDAKNCETPETAAEIFGSIQRIAPEKLFVVARWSLYHYGWLVNGVLQPATHFLASESDAMASLATTNIALSQQLPATIERLAEVAPLTVVLGMPILKTTIDVGFMRDRMNFEPTLAEHRQHEVFTDELLREGMRSAASRGSSVDILDPADLLCGDLRCHAMLGLTVMYHDDNHISGQGALLFRDEILRRVK